MLLAVAPDVFHRVEFRRIGGQKLQMDSALLLGDKVPHRATTMGWQTVPNDCQRSADVPLEVFEKLDDLWSLYAAREEPEIEVPDRDAGNGREVLPVERILQDRSLSTRRPGANSMRSFAQPALVHKDYGSALFERFFLWPASADASTVGGRVHRAAWPGPPDAGNSNPGIEESSKHARGETSVPFAARSNRPPAK